jgi:hypothetical protein
MPLRLSHEAAERLYAPDVIEGRHLTIIFLNRLSLNRWLLWAKHPGIRLFGHENKKMREYPEFYFSPVDQVGVVK